MSTPMLDREYLAEATFEDGALQREILTLFVSQSIKLVETLKTSKDIKELLLAAHTLKGSARGVGAGDVARLCSEIEATIKDDKRPDVEKLSEAVTLLNEHIILQVLPELDDANV